MKNNTCIRFFLIGFNASSYGVPQNRERIFMISILDRNASYKFPEPFPLKKQLTDVLEEHVDDRYYLSPNALVGMDGVTNKSLVPKILSYSRDKKGKVVKRNLKDISNTIHASTGNGGNTDSFVIESDNRIRKLTEREIFRLMDVEDSDIDRIQESGISHRQQRKLAGNSIVVSCLYHIFSNLLEQN